MKRTMLGVVFVSALLISAVAGTLNLVGFGFADTVVSDDWPMLQHDLTRSGFSSSNAPYTNSTLWNYTTYFAYSSPVVAKGKVFTGSLLGKVYCLDSMSGALIWSFDTNQSDQYSIPSIVNDKLYIGVGANVYCLNASFGSLIWNYTTGMGIMGSCPAVVDERVYIGSPDNNMYCLDAATGKLVWNYSANKFVWSSPIIANGMVYFGSHDYNIYALNASNGEKIWSFKTGLFVDSSPAISDGKIYVGSSDGRFYCLDAFTGSLIWYRITGDRIHGAAALVDGKVYFGSQDNKTYCLDARTGAVLWTFTTGGHIFGAAAVADGKVYIGSGDHKVYCLDANSGWLIWSYDTGNYVGMSPAIANGIVYVGSFDVLYAFVGSPDSPAPTPKPSPTPTVTTTPTAAPTPTPTSNQPSPSPKPTPIPYTSAIIKATTNTGVTLDFEAFGNITTSQISSAIITTNQSAETTTLSFTLTGQSGTTGYSNITIQKSVVSYRNSLTVLIDGQPAENQGYTQDTANHYVWYTTHFSSHKISIVFSTNSLPSATSTPHGVQGPISLTQIIYGVAAAAVVIGIILTVLIAVNHGRRRSPVENEALPITRYC